MMKKSVSREASERRRGIRAGALNQGRAEGSIRRTFQPAHRWWTRNQSDFLHKEPANHANDADDQGYPVC